MACSESVEYLCRRCLPTGKENRLRCALSPGPSNRNCIHGCRPSLSRNAASSLRASLGRAGCCFSCCDSTEQGCPESCLRNRSVSHWDSLYACGRLESQFLRVHGCPVC